MPSYAIEGQRVYQPKAEELQHCGFQLKHLVSRVLVPAEVQDVAQLDGVDVLELGADEEDGEAEELQVVGQHRPSQVEQREDVRVEVDGALGQSQLVDDQQQLVDHDVLDADVLDVASLAHVILSFSGIFLFIPLLFPRPIIFSLV